MKTSRGFPLIFVLALLALLPSARAQDVDAIQAALDKGETVALSGTTTLPRPLVMRRDGAKLLGDPRATLKTTGGFPAVMAGYPKPSRRPGFAESKRVPGPAEGYFSYRLAKNAYLSLRNSQFEVGPGQNWDALDQLTICFSATRHRSDLGDGQDSLLCTQPTTGGADPVSITIQGRRCRVTIQTRDGLERYLDVMAPAVGPDWTAVVAMDLAGGKVAAYVNGLAAEVRQLARVGGVTVPVAWTPGLKVRWPELSDCTVGKSSLVGAADITLRGLKFSPRIWVPMDAAAGTPIRRTDGKRGSDGDPVGLPSLLWDRLYVGETVLDMRAEFVEDLVPELVAIRGGGVNERRGFGIILPADWNPYDVVDGLEVGGLTIELDDTYQGACLSWGACLGLKLFDLTLRGGVCGISQADPVTSYPTLIERVRFNGHADSCLQLGYGIVTARDLNFGTGAAPRTHYVLKNRSSDGIISDVVVSQMKSVLDVVKVDRVAGRLDLVRFACDWEDFGPRCYVDAARGQVGPDGWSVLNLHQFRTSKPPAGGGPYFRLRDPWSGRTDVGRVKLVVEDCLEIAGAGPLARLDGIWGGAEAVEVRGLISAAVLRPKPSTEPGEVVGAAAGAGLAAYFFGR